MRDAVKPDAPALCFVDMPFGKKPDLASGTEIDFDQIYQALEPRETAQSGEVRHTGVVGDGERSKSSPFRGGIGT
jgi:hypothetical protein